MCHILIFIFIKKTQLLFLKILRSVNSIQFDKFNYADTHFLEAGIYVSFKQTVRISKKQFRRMPVNKEGAPLIGAPSLFIRFD